MAMSPITMTPLMSCLLLKPVKPMAPRQCSTIKMNRINFGYDIIVYTHSLGKFWFRVNAGGTFLCCREAANRLKRGGGDRIILLSSSLVVSLRPNFASYPASKAAV